MFKNKKDWAISSQASNRGRFNDYPVARSSRNAKCETPKLIKHGEDIVYSFKKLKVGKKIDTGLLILPVKEEDQTALLPITKTNLFSKPNMKLSVYKNRRGKYKGIYLWCDANLSTCRVKPLFATTWNYELIEMDDTHITVEQESAF